MESGRRTCAPPTVRVLCSLSLSSSATSQLYRRALRVVTTPLRCARYARPAQNPNEQTKFLRRLALTHLKHSAPCRITERTYLCPVYSQRHGVCCVHSVSEKTNCNKSSPGGLTPIRHSVSPPLVSDDRTPPPRKLRGGSKKPWRMSSAGCAMRLMGSVARSPQHGPVQSRTRGAAAEAGIQTCSEHSETFATRAGRAREVEMRGGRCWSRCGGWIASRGQKAARRERAASRPRAVAHVGPSGPRAHCSKQRKTRFQPLVDTQNYYF